MIVDLPVPLAEGADLPVALDSEFLDTPAVLIDLDVVEANIKRMAQYAEREGVDLRPHVKTHKSPLMARRQLEHGAVGICVAKVSEAEVMVAAGLNDVTIAYPIIGTAKLARLARLVGKASLTLVADSEMVLEGYESLAMASGSTLDVLVEVDTGMHRIGVNPDLVIRLAGAVRSMPHLSFAGLLTHAGHAHDASDAAGIERVAREEARILGTLREELEAANFEVPVVSAGSTLTAPFLSSRDGITEIRPGTYIYNDLRTVACWSATLDQIAATALVTVVSTDGDRVTVDAGNKTLTLTHEVEYGFGHVLGRPEMVVTRLSEEHGVLTSPTYRPKVGEHLRILPIHVCVWMDLQAEAYGIRAGQIVERIPIPAMRHSL
jgi:D-serine deaminase-like pyridoxal phosphate-dependent protein